MFFYKKQQEKKITYIFLADLHIPFQNKIVLEKIKYVLEEIQPQKIFFLGDILDFPSLSIFNKDLDRFDNLQEEIEEFKKFFLNFFKNIKTEERYYILGNHEERLKNFLLSKAKCLSKLKALDLKNLLELDKLKFNLIENYFFSPYKNLICLHGNKFGQNPSRKMYNMFNNINGISAHAHKTDIFYNISINNRNFWITIGHLSNQKLLEYSKYHSWDASFLILQILENKNLFLPFLIEITKTNNFYCYETKKYY